MRRPLASSSARCCGSQPFSAVAEPLSSSASRKACERNGLPAPAQASHSAAGSSAMRSMTRTVRLPPPSGMVASILASGVARPYPPPQPSPARQGNRICASRHFFVMAGLDPAIHVFTRGYISVDDRDKPGHDDEVGSEADRQMRLPCPARGEGVAAVLRLEPSPLAGEGWVGDDLCQHANRYFTSKI